MENNSSIQILIDKFYQGTISNDELESLNKWILNNKKAENNNKEVDKLFLNSWMLNELLISNSETQKQDVQGFWEKAAQTIEKDFKINDDNASIVNEYRNKSQRISNSSPKKYLQWFKIAAAIIPLILVLTYFYSQLNITSKQDIVKKEYFEKATLKGEKVNLELPDGSFIKLNSNSSIKFEKGKAFLTNRVVELKGEAFFDVMKRDGQNFKVLSQGVITEVLGTSFNINCSQAYNNVQVAVLTGKVKVSFQESNKQVFLLPNEEVVCKTDQENFKKTSISNMEEVFAWKDNVLFFNSLPLTEVLEKLELWYGVKFILEEDISVDYKYKGQFKNLPLETVLEGLGFSAHFNYKIEDKKVFIRKN